MGRKGSQKNERKVNQERYQQAVAQEEKARSDLRELKRLPLFSRPADYDAKLKTLAGMLKRATSARQKSETHSRRGKQGQPR